MSTRIVLFTALLFTAHAATAQQSNLATGESHSWAGNLGWIELKPNGPTTGDGIRVTDSCLSGFAWSDSTGWINFGDGTPEGGLHYSNRSNTDFGVNIGLTGNLNGRAWSANLGWITFSWATPDDENRPRINLQTGDFSGYAWSRSAGWITLGTGSLRTTTILITDTDGDGISDAWEHQHGSQLSDFNATSDSDGDGMSDHEEFLADTDPRSPASYLSISNMTQTPDGEPALNLTTSLTWPSSPARLYKIQYSSDLTSWQIAAPGLLTPDSGTQTTRGVTHPITDYLFFRIETLLPLQP